MELKDKYRPKSLDKIVEQPAMVSALKGFIAKNKIPHSMLFSGAAGCGKTTAARVVADLLKCGPTDFHEINSANFRGIDTVREIQQRINLHAIGGKSRVWLIDEAHQLTKDAQNGLLKILEECPKHVYFMLCTTDSAN